MKYSKEHELFVDFDENIAFAGVLLDQIPQFKKFFKINVNIFELTEKDTAICIYKSRCHVCHKYAGLYT